MKRMSIYAGVLSAFLLAQGANADNDSSADVAVGFQSTLSQSPGLILRVNIDEQGREDTGSAILRVATEEVKGEAELEKAFEKGADTSTQAQVTQADIDADSSTFGFFPIRFSFGYQPYYYNYYRPTYYHSGYYYNYGRPYYHYNNHYRHHRYYYYPRHYRY